MAYSNERMKEFAEIAKPLIKWINDNGNPHMTVLIDNTRAELFSGEFSVRTEEFWKD